MNFQKFLNSFSLLGLLLFQVLPLAIILFHLYGFSKWTEDSGWIENVEKNCKYFTNHNFQNRHFTWSGDCREGFAHGEGKLTLFEGGKALYQLEGFLNMGKMEGYAKMQFLKDGDLYEGSFKNSRLHGAGHYYNDDGDHYEGEYKNGQKSGYGVYWYEPDRSELKYAGFWKADQKNGEGILYYRNGEKIRGEFVDGVLIKKSSLKPVQNQEPPKNILITNDDGVEDLARLECLAEAMSRFADLVVVAVSRQNQSGTSNSMLIPKQGFIQTRRLSADTSRQIFIYEVEGYPSDCVLLAALGIFKEKGKTIDLVVSGINGGANYGAQWFGSGTIGAARTAALAKIPAIAVSGIDEDNEQGENLKKICRWTADFVQSPIIQTIRPLEYLTISLPENLDDIKGIKILERAITFDAPPFYLEKEKTSSPKTGAETTWVLKPVDASKTYQTPAEHDVFYYHQNYIVVVPMSVNENNADALPRYKLQEAELPVFQY